MITYIRYFNEEKIEFDWNGHIVRIADPKDVVLVGVPIEYALPWIKKNFGFLLDALEQNDNSIKL